VEVQILEVGGEILVEEVRNPEAEVQILEVGVQILEVGVQILEEVSAAETSLI
jgi:hypothetical protein